MENQRLLSNFDKKCASLTSEANQGGMMLKRLQTAVLVDQESKVVENPQLEEDDDNVQDLDDRMRE